MKLFSSIMLAAVMVTMTVSAVPVFAFDGPTKLLVTPAAPTFTTAERQAELAKRRAAVAAKMADNSVLVLMSAESKLYTNDVDYVYRQENNLYYLTSLKQDGATLVIEKAGGKVTQTLYLPKRVPIREAWEGKMYSREQATEISGLTSLKDSTELKGVLESLTAKNGTFASTESVYMLLPADENDVNGRREFAQEAEMAKKLISYKVQNAQPIFAELRHIKSPYELKLLQHAIDITTEAQMRSMATVGRANWEYEVHAEVEYTFRRRNADFWGYPSIVGCGANATTLHYVESQSPVKKGELLLMDVGAEYEHYTADVTRTYPVNGKFTKEQAEIYQIVYDAQEAVAKATKPGVSFGQLSGIASNTIRDGLFKLGLVTDKNSNQHRLWFIHGLGHWLGMNVHDVGDYAAPLKAGMVFTNEPGIYIREDALDNLPNTPEMNAFKEKIRPAFEKYKNIGVRIEDDLLVTETGVSWMTGKLPRSIKDIERFMVVGPKQVTLSQKLEQNIFTNGTLNAE